MSNAVTALNGASSVGYVTVNEGSLTGMITLRGNFSDKEFSKAINTVLGGKIPKQRKMVNAKKCQIGWMSPDELLVICDYSQANALVDKLTKALATTHCLIQNVSDARAIFHLEGVHIREVIAKVAPVDMSPSTFEIGELRRTRFAQVPAAFWLSDDASATVVCFRSVAHYMFDLLSVSAKEGTQVNPW